MNEFDVDEVFYPTFSDRNFKRLSTHYYVFCDIENTGGNVWNNSLLSAGVVVTDKEFKEIDTFYETVRPDSRGWDTRAEGVHGFTKVQAAKFQCPTKFCAKLLDFLQPFKSSDNSPLPFVYHASYPLDWRFIYYTFIKNSDSLEYELLKIVNSNNLVSTFQLAKQAGHKRLGLKDLCRHYNISLDNHHNALSDAKALVPLIKAIKEDCFEENELMHSLRNQQKEGRKAG